MGQAKMLEHDVAMFRTTSAFRALQTRHIRSTKASWVLQTPFNHQLEGPSSYSLSFVHQLLEMSFQELQSPSRKAITETPI